MTELTIDKNKLKPVVLDALNEFFNISDFEEFKHSFLGRLIGLEIKMEVLINEIQNFSSSFGINHRILQTEIKVSQIDSISEMKATNKALETKLDHLISRVAFQEKLQYLTLAAAVVWFIKLIFFF
ncbi:hypothetical protein L0337_45185 [candidate division KSB1 bacterium]|nr:hypothetical protein [candidate division KSB1 bacterium]